MENADATMTVVGHLTELRSRLIKSLAALACTVAVSYYFIDTIVAFLAAPAGPLYFMRPAEAFFIYFKVALVTGALGAAPVLLYEFWAFLVPAFTTRERSMLLLLVPSSLVLFAAGIALAYFVVLPQGLKFFMDFSSSTVQPMISLESYLDFVIMLVLPFGFIFNLPLLLITLAQAGLLRSPMLKKGRRYVIFLAFVASALITPTTDIITQSLLALPMILLYEISLLIIRYGLKK